MASSAERHVQVGFSILFFVLGVIGAMSYYSVMRLREDADGISHTHEVIASINSIASDVLGAVAAERGFALTGDKTYLEQYDTAERAAEGGLGVLARLVADNPAQLERLKNVTRLVTERMAFVRGVNETYREKGIDAVRAELAKGTGRALSGRIAAEMDEFEVVERALLSERIARAERVTTRAKLVILAGGVLALVSVTLALYLLTRDFAGRRRAEAQLHASMNGLEARVHERTADLAHANKALLEREERLRGVIQSAMDAVITVDDNQSIVLFNAAAEGIFGCTAAEAVGGGLDRFIPQRFRAAHHEHIKRFGETGTTTRRMGARLTLYGLRTNGEEFPIDASISQVTVDGEKYYTVILRDVSERRRAEEALERSYGELRELSRIMNEVREAERTRVARELHDELAQWLTALKMDVAWLAARLPAGQHNLVERTERMKGVVDTTVASIRRIAADLRPVMLDDLGLVPAIENLVGSLAERANIAVRLDVRPRDLELKDPLATAVYRMVQEALTNVARHAQATEVRVTLARDADALIVCVSDNGVGLPPPAQGRKSYGLLGIRERAQTLGGSARISSSPEGGTVVEISIPLARYAGTETAT